MIIPTVKEFAIESGLVSQEEWDWAEVRALKADGNISLENLFRELTDLPFEWEVVENLEHRITPYHRQILHRISEGRKPGFPGVRVGNYLLLSQLGRGGQGRVYCGADTVTQTPQIRSRVRLIKISARGDRRLHERESEILKRLSKTRHNRFPQFYVRGVDRGRPYLVMSYRAGLDLRKHIKAQGPFPLEQAVLIARKLVETLQVASDAGILHRDIKPSNVIFDPSNKRLTLIDWGLGAIVDNPFELPDPFSEAPALSHSATKLGTFAWMSPEHFKSSREIVPDSDIYAAGCVLFYLLTGQAPFEGSAPELTYHHTQSPRPLVSECQKSLDLKTPIVPQMIDSLVQSMMSIRIKDRPDTQTILSVLKESLVAPKHIPKKDSSSNPRTKVAAPATLKETQDSVDCALDDTSVHRDTKQFDTGKTSRDRTAPFPNRSTPQHVNTDYIFRALPSFFDLSQLKWPAFSRNEEKSFLKTLSLQREQFDSDASEERASVMQRLAFEKSRHGNMGGAIDQWQEAWLATPWDFTLKRYCLNAMREHGTPPRNIGSAVPKPSSSLRDGNVFATLQACEARLKRNPWCTYSLWEEAMALDLLGYWHTCSLVIETLIKTYFQFDIRPIPMLIVSARVSACVGEYTRARRLLNVITKMDERYAKSSEFHDLVNGVEAEILSLRLEDKQAR